MIVRANRKKQRLVRQAVKKHEQQTSCFKSAIEYRKKLSAMRLETLESHLKNITVFDTVM